MSSSRVKDEKRRIRLDDVFLAISEPLKAVLSSTSATIIHPGTKGDASEFQWLNWLRTYLPKRYEINKGFVIDSDAYISDQQDIIIYDRQYSPYLLSREGVIYVPAESVYAVIEVKQKLNKKYIEYASEKVRSVRRLKRTSIPIYTAEGVIPPKPPQKIIGGLVCLSSDWKKGINSRRLEKALKEIDDENGRIDIGCCLESGSFTVNYNNEGTITIERSTAESALIFFFIRLMSMLQQLGTVSAIDFNSYAKNLSSFEQSG